MSRAYRRRPAAPDGAQQHREWLSLVEVSGPFLSLPVLRETWPNLDALDRKTRERLRVEHATWQDDTVGGQRAWIDYVLRDLLGWAEALHESDLDALAVTIAEHDTEIRPSFALVEPGEDVKPDTARLLGVVCPAGTQPTARVPGSPWAASYVDRLAHLCRQHNVELGLATDGRWWALVWAPRGGVTTTAVFDAVSWSEAAERVVVRAFVSLLCRQRFFGVPEDERLVKLLRDSADRGEEITEALGVQVRKAVELLVAAVGRADVRDRERGGPGLADVAAHDVYRGAVAVMMRIVFLLFAEERKLLPSDNDLYVKAYSAGRLCAELEQRVIEGSEEDLEHSFAAWYRLLALFTAVYQGVDHPRLVMHGHDGSLFDPQAYPWLPLTIDDRTVLHMLRAVQYVEVGKGRDRERRKLSFRSLDVEQIGYVYEGLLSFEGFRAEDVTVGLVGKEGLEEEVPLADLETLARRAVDVPGLAAALAEKYKDSKIGSAAALAKRLAPLEATEQEEARKKLLAVTGGDYPLAQRLLPFVGIIREDLRGLPVVILPGALFVTESALRKNTGTHYTPSFLAKQVVEGALEPLVYEPGPLQTADKTQWKLKSSEQILALKVADIAMGSAAFLVAAARYLGERLIEAWDKEGDERARAYLDSAGDRVLGVDEDPLVIEARRQIIEHCLYGVDINPMAVEMAKLSLWLVSMDPQRPFTFLDDRLVAG
ncbi:MAG TPA: SAM-dependent DNA methyltransferase, partial [Micromonosporaceae bacterium]